jgi:hypothetical protein
LFDLRTNMECSDCILGLLKLSIGQAREVRSDKRKLRRVLRGRWGAYCDAYMIKMRERFCFDIGDLFLGEQND